MLKQHRLVQFAIVTSALVLAACAATTVAPTLPTSAPTAAAVTVSLQPTSAPTATASTAATAAVLPDSASMKVGLVTDTGGVNDHAFNQLAWEGLQRAADELGFEARVIESQLPADYERNIDALATEGYDVIITVGSSMGDATALKAKQYPTIKFAIIDRAYAPTSGSQSCNDTVNDCYADGGLTNVTSLMFAEHQIGFLAGVLAGGMSQSGFVCSVSSMRTPASERYILSFFSGATWQAGSEMQIMNNYINIQTTDDNVPNFMDSTEGQETAQRLIGSGCDVVFSVAANGALLAARQNNVMAIGVDVDQYYTTPEAQVALLSSAQKNVNVAVYNYLTAVVNGSVSAGISTGNLQNGGVGLSPFHDWDSRIPADLKAQIQRARDGIVDGSITVDLP